MPKASKSTASSRVKDPGLITVTGQQSRFHTDAVDAPALKDVDVKDLTISIGEHEILDHAHLRLFDGVHYVFSGRNGTGKSTLLKALAERRIPGVPSNLRILLLGQTRVSSDLEDDSSIQSESNRTVLEYVTRSDTHRERALREANCKSGQVSL